jgi:hypothetical protein
MNIYNLEKLIIFHFLALGACLESFIQRLNLKSSIGMLFSISN